MLQFMKQLAVFMIVGKTMIHFCPSEKYEKYIKLLFGFMVVIQFITPVLSLGSGVGMDGYEQRKSELEAKLEESLLSVEEQWFLYNEEIEKKIASDTREAEELMKMQMQQAAEDAEEAELRERTDVQMEEEQTQVDVEKIKIEVLVHE